jgi:hypothetical protein
LPDRENAEVPQLDTIAARHRRDNLLDLGLISRRVNPKKEQAARLLYQAPNGDPY